MPGPENENVTDVNTFDIISLEPKLKEGASINEKVDYLLEHWDTGLFADEDKGMAVYDAFKASDNPGKMNRVLLTESIDALYNMGLCGGPDYWPTVDDMIETGNCILIARPDGSYTTYTDEFFKDNPTVEKLRELEKTNRGAGPHGLPMAVHLAQFLTEGKKRGVLKNTDKAFHALNPADHDDAFVSVSIPGRKHVLISPMPKEKLAVYNETKEKCQTLANVIADTEKKREEKKAAADANDLEFDDVKQQLTNFGPAPVVPAKPVEKNFFRRFFCRLGFRHSEDYNRRLREYEDLVRQRGEYEGLQQKITDFTARKNTDTGELEALNTQIDVLQNQFTEAQNKMGEYSKIAQVFKGFVDAAAARDYAKKIEDAAKEEKKAAESKEAGRELAGKLLQRDNVAKIINSDVPELVKGSVIPTIELMNHTVNGRHLNLNNSVHLSQISGGINRLSEVLMDTQSASTYNNGLNKLRLKAHAKDLDKAERQTAYANYTKAKENLFNEYNARVRNSKALFKEVFGVDANVINVQKVIDGSDFKNRLKQYAADDANVTTAAVPQIPQVTEENLGAMTLLLMGGLKTVSKELQARAGGQIASDKVRVLDPEEGKKRLKEQQEKEEQVREFKMNRKDRLLGSGEEEVKPEATGPKV